MPCPAATIQIHRLPGMSVDIVPAPVGRGWMDRSRERAAYRCLPMNIANAHGWQILCRAGFSVRWNGTSGTDALEFRYDTPGVQPAISHFGAGIVTFDIPAVFRTPPGVAIFAMGPTNANRLGLAPLSGVVETDWLPFTFTMNWQVYARDHWISFRKGDPYCQFFPVRLDELEGYALELHDLADSPELHSQFSGFSESRRSFLAEMKDRDSDAARAQWQRDYFRGHGIDAERIKHRTSLKLARPKPAGG
ncbi:MAG: DUF6065 family protein [Rhodobacteraceae bacterium]|nr:DUF6065 family protein [Paracoccaceae bacterium]